MKGGSSQVGKFKLFFECTCSFYIYHSRCELCTNIRVYYHCYNVCLKKITRSTWHECIVAVALSFQPGRWKDDVQAPSPESRHAIGAQKGLQSVFLFSCLNRNELAPHVHMDKGHDDEVCRTNTGGAIDEKDMCQSVWIIILHQL